MNNKLIRLYLNPKGTCPKCLKALEKSNIDGKWYCSNPKCDYWEY